MPFLFVTVLIASAYSVVTCGACSCNLILAILILVVARNEVLVVVLKKSINGWMNFLERPHRHRRLRHHQKGIQQIIDFFGEKAGRVARLHIVSDLKEEGWSRGDPFPKDEEDYVRLGFR